MNRNHICLRLPVISRIVWRILPGSIATVLCLGVVAATPSQSERESSLGWWKRTFPLTPAAEAAQIETLYADVPDAISRGRSWRGSSFQLGERTYAHGIAFNSNRHIRVRFGQPGERFVAEVGLENSDDTRQGETLGNGSVTFHVFVHGKELFHSAVLRLKDGAVPVNIALDGAREFELRIQDGGDGTGWDQGLWAEATVTLAGGIRLRLQDLPMADATAENPFGFSFLYGEEPSTTLLKSWPRESHEERLDEGQTCRKTTWRDPTTGLEVRVESIALTDFPAVEWVVHFKNTGSQDSPILQAIQAFDGLVLPGAASPRLHWAKGPLPPSMILPPRKRS